MTARRFMTTRARVTAWATLGFVTLQLAWIISVIPYYGIDEFDHALRASSVADGHWHATHHLPPEGTGRGDLIRVRGDVATTAEPACNSRPYTGLYNCYPQTNPPGNEVIISSGAARYNPAFYWFVGSVAKPFHGNAALFAMRVATATLCALVFALAIWLMAGTSRSIWPVTTGLLAALPTTVYSTAVAAPNGLNIIAGLAVWASLMALSNVATRRGGYLGLAVSSAVLLNTHTLGLVWFALILVSFALLAGAREIIRSILPRGRTEVLVLLLALSAAAFDVWWVLTSGVNDPGQERTVFDGAPWSFIARGLVLWPLQAVGAFPMRNDSAPVGLYAIAFAALGLVSVLAIGPLRLRSRTTAALAFVVVASFLVPACLTAATFHEIGAAWQGRYQMPFTVGLIIITGSILDRSPRLIRFATLNATIAVAAMALAQAVGQLKVVREERRIDSLVVATDWTAPGPLLLLTLSLLAAGCWIMAVRTSRGLAPSAAEPDVGG